MDTSLVLVILKLLKKVKKAMIDFPRLFKRLASTLERIVPLVTDIEKLEKGLNPSSKQLKFLTETTRRALEVVRECSHIRGYDLPKKKRYINEIEEINQKLLTFCQLDIPLIGLRDSLLQRSLKEITTGRSLYDEDEQMIILESLKDDVKDKNKQRVILESIKDNVQDEDDQWAILESIKDNLKDEDDQLVILESIKDNGKRKQVQADEQFALCVNMEQLHAHQKIDSPFQEFNFRSHQQVAERRRALDEQIANGLVYDEAERLTNGSTSSTTTLGDEAEQRAILESYKKK